MNDFNTSIVGRKSIKTSTEIHDILSAYAKEKRLNITEVLKILIEWLPVYEVCNKQELTIEAAINKLSAEYKTGKVWDKNNKPVTSKTLDNFSYWIEKIINHNENSTLENRVYITQRLLLNMTRGNVNMISKAFKDRESEIMEHNKLMGVDESTNRKLSHKIRNEHGTVSEWLTKILA